MRGEITVRKKRCRPFSETIEVESDGKNKAISFTSGRRDLRAELRSHSSDELTCHIFPPEEEVIAFDFSGVETIGTVSEITGRNFWTGRFVPWRCSFKRLEG